MRREVAELSNLPLKSAPDSESACHTYSGCLAAAVFRYDLWASSTKLDSHCTMSTAQETQKNCLLVALAHFAACMGDTLASELGILSARKPFLLFSARPRVVPPGTNGGISLLGTVSSALGGLWIGFVFTASLLAFNPACWVQAATSIVPRLLILATLSGLGGSMIDSLLGATMQKTWYNVKTKQILVGTRRLKRKADDDDQWQVITGYDILTNNQVSGLAPCCLWSCSSQVNIDSNAHPSRAISYLLHSPSGQLHLVCSDKPRCCIHRSQLVTSLLPLAHYVNTAQPRAAIDMPSVDIYLQCQS